MPPLLNFFIVLIWAYFDPYFLLMFFIGIVLPFNEKNEMAKTYVDQFFGNVTKLYRPIYNSQIAQKSYPNSVYTYVLLCVRQKGHS